jgi:hypothetical protein
MKSSWLNVFNLARLRTQIAIMLRRAASQGLDSSTEVDVGP